MDSLLRFFGKGFENKYIWQAVFALKSKQEKIRSFLSAVKFGFFVSLVKTNPCDLTQ